MRSEVAPETVELRVGDGRFCCDRLFACLFEERAMWDFLFLAILVG